MRSSYRSNNDIDWSKAPPEAVGVMLGPCITRQGFDGKYTHCEQVFVYSYPYQEFDYHKVENEYGEISGFGIRVWSFRPHPDFAKRIGQIPGNAEYMNRANGMLYRKNPLAPHSDHAKAERLELCWQGHTGAWVETSMANVALDFNSGKYEKFPQAINP